MLFDQFRLARDTFDSVPTWDSSEGDDEGARGGAGGGTRGGSGGGSRGGGGSGGGGGSTTIPTGTSGGYFNNLKDLQCNNSNTIEPWMEKGCDERCATKKDSTGTPMCTQNIIHIWDPILKKCAPMCLCMACDEILDTDSEVPGWY